MLQRTALYPRLMGDRFAALPLAVRSMHELDGEALAVGEGSVLAGGGLIGRLTRTLMGFPPAGSYPVRVEFAACDGQETWTRRFGEHRFRSRLSARNGKLAERFGALRFKFDLSSDAGGLRMVLAGWDFVGIPLPKALAPRIEAAEWEEAGWFRFDVAVALPKVGQVMRYCGRLQRQPSVAGS